MSENIGANGAAIPGRGPSILPAILAGVVTATLFGLGGYALISDGDGSMGAVLFLLLPVATGFATAVVAGRGTVVAASLILALILCTVVLLLVGAEGYVCVITSAPLIAAGLTIGAVCGRLFRRIVIDQSKHGLVLKILALVAIPGFLAGANRIEQPSRRTPRLQTVTTSTAMKAAPARVWNEVKSLDGLKASKHFLMKIGLPVPVSCVMEGEGVGARRTCFFESGHIEERITAWDPPRRMGMEITASDVPGRPWLTFQDATYVIEETPEGCTITRSTTIVSHLSPAWYWRRLERLGVEIEHDYLFEGLKNRLEGSR